MLSITETATATFAGVISDGGRSGASGGGLVVNGPGKLVLTGANTFTGGIVLPTCWGSPRAILRSAIRPAPSTPI